MSKNVVEVPDIGDHSDVEVIEVSVSVGDEIAQEDTLITLETDKATMDIPSSQAGRVSLVHVNVGDKVSRGSPIATVEAVEETESSESVSEPSSEPEPSSDSKASPNEVQPVSSPPSKETVAPSADLPEPVKHASQSSQHSEAAYSSPWVRRLARQLGVDLLLVRGTGRKGRITPEDLYGYVQAKLAEKNTLGVPEAPSVDFERFGEISEEPLSRIRKRTADNMHRNWLLVPHVTQFDEADITEMEAFRQAEKEAAMQRGYKLTPLVFIMKAVVSALKAYPHVNASLHARGDALVLKHYYHVGVAVDTEQGLVVPVIRDVDQKTLSELAIELRTTSEKARQGRLSAEDMQGGCFTISSLGGVGGCAFTPIVNVPEVAILGISKSEMKPVYCEGQWIPRLKLPLSLSYDHRVIDGAYAARFLSHLSMQLSDIRRLLM